MKFQTTKCYWKYKSSAVNTLNSLSHNMKKKIQLNQITMKTTENLITFPVTFEVDGKSDTKLVRASDENEALSMVKSWARATFSKDPDNEKYAINKNNQ